MVSLLPPQSDATLPGPARLEGEPQGDLMQAPGLPGSPAPQNVSTWHLGPAPRDTLGSALSLPPANKYPAAPRVQKCSDRGLRLPLRPGLAQGKAVFPSGSGTSGLGAVNPHRPGLPKAGYISSIIWGPPGLSHRPLYPSTEPRPGPASTHRLSTLYPPQKLAGFSCSSFVPDGPPERASSLPPQSPSVASPGPEQVHCPAGAGPGPFRLSPSDKFTSFGFEEGPASSPGHFLKGGHGPFHPYKRHFHEDVFPEAQTALALDGHSFKTPGALETFEEIPVDVGEAEAFLPGFSAEAWCNGLPYPSQEHSPQVLVSTSSRLLSLLVLRSPEIELHLPFPDLPIQGQ